MRKVLIISHYFSDQRAIAAVRINGLAKFLPKFGWEPSILTSKMNPIPLSEEKFKVFEAPCEDACIKWMQLLGLGGGQSIRGKLNLPIHKNKQDRIDLIINLWQELFAYPDSLSHWRKIAIRLGDELAATECFDAIISSSGPPTCNLIAKDLKEKHDLPWIADFRDLWTQNHYYRYSKFRRFLEQRLELKTLSSADALTTVSRPLSEKLKQFHKGKDVYVITNGFDPDNINCSSPLKTKFTITYTGLIYRGFQDPEPLFIALRDLIDDDLINPEYISVEFYGNEPAWLVRDIRKYNLENIVKTFGLISRDSSLEKQRRSHLLLLLTWNDPQEKGIYTGKIFDYLAAQRPILSIGRTSGCVAEQLLKETNSGVHCCTDEDIKYAIMNAFAEFKGHNTVSYHGNLSRINLYSHVEMAKRFSEILDELVVC
jgi:glycosyltransferase involved in cell wall biosynthesis